MYFLAAIHPGADHARCSLIGVIKRKTLYRIARKASSLAKKY
jgi:hypothetical protein